MASHPSDDNVQIIPFCVPLPLHSSPSSPIDASASGEISSFGVVGTITIRGHSAVVWFGWGTIEACDDRGSNYISRWNNENGIISVGCGKPPMGPIAVSMPPLPQNASKLDGTPTSQLLGGNSDEDMILGQQMSARLAKRVGWPIFVSCSFSDLGGDIGGLGGGAMGNGGSGVESLDAMSAGLDDGMPQRCSALAEREVGRILLELKNKGKT
mmetsp:Transcript_20084/g.41470  ORF Transcript_20084/g.41470 Transcript_20084/m.41470 type:complete len:212 (+) Transcript_20084:94-729(+)